MVLWKRRKRDVSWNCSVIYVKITLNFLGRMSLNVIYVNVIYVNALMESLDNYIKILFNGFNGSDRVNIKIQFIKYN